MQTPSLIDMPPREGLWLEIDAHSQRLRAWQGDMCRHECDISTGRQGLGNQQGSGQTPLGWHYIRAAIGADAPENAVFKGRRWTGEVFNAELAAAFPERDWILTRILWLCGLEPGINRGGQVDSQRRYIYLHGTPPDQPMGQPASHGCVRLRNADLLWLFEHAVPGTPVWLHDSR
ncbi:L,D-transpeptidase catalytic domain [Vreelandella subterranea]|uniref:L,D-transpeptidase catalytic domain n=1 Tax=Vreelandella subterranea TaxID=416874 RepID=A0A1H9VJ68_9GAMM|nr:L,D-transpeptidase [Halomonas subterranea]SES21357.1 L,D-transpeptidase catalytic domain [Halomonas subterranea]